MPRHPPAVAALLAAAAACGFASPSPPLPPLPPLHPAPPADLQVATLARSTDLEVLAKFAGDLAPELGMLSDDMVVPIVMDQLRS